MGRKARRAAKKRDAGHDSAPVARAADPYLPGYLLALLTGLVPLVFVLLRTPGWNGTPYWPWRYSETSVWPFLGLAVLAWGLVILLERRSSGDRIPWRTLLALAALHATLSIAFVGLSTRGFETLRERVMHPDITSYHTEATRQDDIEELLAYYPRKLPGMLGHAQTHPPGPILYYVFWNRLVGAEAGALWGGAFLAVFAAMGVLGAALAGYLVAGSSAAIGAAIWFALLPGSLAMLGSFDAVYPAITAGVVAAWGWALWRDSRWAAAAAALLSVALFLAHQFYTLGVALAVLTIWYVVTASSRGVALRKAALALGIASAVSLSLYGLLYWATRYDAVGALQASMYIQSRLEAAWNRPYELTIAWDMYDFFLASGWVSAGVLAVFLWRWRGGGATRGGHILSGFVWAALFTLAVVDLSGMLRAETARVWLFLQPLVLVLLGVEVARWPAGARYAVYGVLCFAMAVIRARMIFL